MRLLICNISHSLQGGVENIVADLCRHLPSRGIEAILGLARGGRFNDPDRYRAAFPDLPAVVIDGAKGTRQARLEGLLKTIRQVRPDIVLIARVFDAYEAVTRLKRRHGWPRLAVTIQAYEPHYLYDARLYRDHIDLCVTSGELVRQGVCRWSGLAAERVISIPGGVRPPLNPPQSRRPGGVLRLGYVGRLDPDQKRIFDLVPVVQGLDQAGLAYRLDVVGGGPAEAELRRRLAAGEQAGRIVFHGWQDYQALYGRIYPALDVLVHFAHTEGVTIAPREAMAHGVTPVISRFAGLKTEGQFLDGVNALTFPVGDTAAAVGQILRLWREPGLLERLSASAMISQQGKYSYEGALDAWAEAFRACLARPPVTGPRPRLRWPPDGRLARLGVPPWLAQRLRDLAGVRCDHADGSGEWPTGSGLMTADAAREIMALAEEKDN